MKIRTSLYALLGIFTLLGQRMEAVSQPDFASIGTDKNSALSQTLEYLKQQGEVDFAANALARFEEISKTDAFQERMSKVPERLAATLSARSSFQPAVDCKIPVTLIPEGTVLIDKPGYYVLDCQNLDYAVNPFGFIPAIQIISEDVTLDLNGLTIRQADPTIPFGYAIQIGYGYFPATLEEQNFVAKNVIIKNGTIKQFTGCGILAFNNTFGTLFGDPATTRLPFEDIQLYDVNVLECGLVTRDINEADLLGINGISFFAINTANTYGFKNVVFDSVHVNDTVGAAVSALVIDRGENISITNSTANNTINTGFDDPGFAIPYTLAAFYVQGKNIQLFKCQANGTKDLHDGVFSTGAQVGSFFQRSFDVYLRECQFNDTYGENNAIINVNPSNTYGWLAENCQFSNNRGGLKAGLVCGVHLSDSPTQVVTANGMKWVNCQFNNHSVNPNNPNSSFICGYIAITATNVEFVDCQSCNIQAPSPNHIAFGILNGVLATDPFYPFGNVTSTIVKGCTVSNITGNASVFGLGSLFDGGTRARQALNSNLAVEDCIVQNLRSFSTDTTDKIGGIAQVLLREPLDDLIVPQVINVLVKNSRVSDVLHQPGGDSKALPNANSAGILLESVQYPTLLNNSVSNCDKGILLTGLEEIIPNAFQLAATEENAFANPPLPINIGTSNILTISAPGLANPLAAIYTIRGPRLDEPLTAPMELADPVWGCSPLSNDLTGKIGIIIDEGACPSSEAIDRVEAAGAVATIIINFGNQNNPVFTGSPNQTKPAMAISRAAGTALLNALTPGLEGTVTPLFPTFTNLVQGNQTGVNFISPLREVIVPDENLTALGWQRGDTIQYHANGATISGLVDGQTYFLIVYRPGFSENGIVQDNKVQTNRIAGIEDAKAPCTSSLFTTNNAFCNGLTHKDNYTINWGSPKNAPVAKGTLSSYAKPSYWSENISTTCGACDCPEKPKAKRKRR